MNKAQQKIEYATPPLFRYLSIVILLTFLFALPKAQAEEGIETTAIKKTFMTPLLLSQVNISNSADTLTLLNKKQFHQQLLLLAKQLSAATINQQSMFNKIALLSILTKHKTLLETVAEHKNAISYSHYALHSKTQLKLEQLVAEKSELNPFIKTLTNDFSQSLVLMDDEALFQKTSALNWSVLRAQDYVHNVFERYQNLAELNVKQAVDLIVNAHLYHVLSKVLPVSDKLLAIENNKRYDIQADTLITTPDGIELSATIVRKKNTKGKLPTALQFTIYADESAHIKTATHAAAHGYVGIVANSRGKRSSTNEISPWEFDGEDARRVIDWASKQSWSNGDVVMYGGSYNGFTQWAAAKKMHPALKAMAPYAAASLITGLPYENNILLTGNYPWAFHVTNNKTMDNSVYSDWQSSENLQKTLFESGRAIKDIDKIDGKANPWFQKWLEHPSFDSYYQKMVPYQTDYTDINIPVLSVTGYFDGGQISSLDYLKRHYKYNKNANHSLLIGPYGHISAQRKPRSHYSNYQLDEVALEKDTDEVVFAWFDHLLFNKEQPKLVQDKVNYQLMGSNTWRHSKSLDELNKQSIAFYLASSVDDDGHFTLLTSPEKQSTFVSQTVDMTNRTTEHNRAPWPIIQKKLNEPNGIVYITEAFESTQELAGAITGTFEISVNKKDVDIGYNFYEIDKDGEVFHFNTYRSRASFANDMSKRKLLIPNKKTSIPIINARMTAKLINKGSRLVIVLNINKNVDAQVNLGSGKYVNEETLKDAGEPLKIKWFNDSKINIPLKPWTGD
ncbi:CocE/NonD family hydrolase [Colwellia psychrerythraea]|uniref:Hydrolase CocE/NonD family protein n=1 Tax=Colwellia psychrerythraea TaxID=28229 RepID=A0A099L336_COLPS|nr:CocE/NonD family hydrolase [Colwellia psychrerythraea]KGJ96860.1 hydrolase CocE/NonD family protein [Colwellia psychrerythraea]